MKQMKKIQSFYPTLTWSWTLIAVFLACTIVIAVPAGWITNLAGNNPAIQSWGLLAGYVLPFVCVAGFILLLQRTEPATALLPVKKNLSPAVFLCCLAFTPLLAFLIEPLTVWLPMPDAMKEIFAQLSKSDFPTFLMVAVAAPFCEEWLCRGVIARGLLRHGTPAKAILWSAFIFAVIHLNPWQAVPAFIIGLLLGYVYWKTRSLWPCIFIHFINNGASFLVLYLFPQAAAADATSQTLLGHRYWVVFALAAIAAACIGAAFYLTLNGGYRTWRERR
jgi:membrane protease YdiL (CAAX protease family)